MAKLENKILSEPSTTKTISTAVQLHASAVVLGLVLGVVEMVVGGTKQGRSLRSGKVNTTDELAFISEIAAMSTTTNPLGNLMDRSKFGFNSLSKAICKSSRKEAVTLRLPSFVASTARMGTSKPR